MSSPGQKIQLYSVEAQVPPPARTRAIGARTPLAAVLLFLVSFGIATAHHIYNYKINNTAVQGESQQAWSIRLGVAAAFLVQTGLVALMVMASNQQIWKTLRAKAISLSCIDSMFAITSDKTAIFNRDLLAHAKLLTFFPLVA